MATYTVFNATTATATPLEPLVRESVSDYISNLFPLDTPLHQVLRMVPMQNVFTQQPVDTFAGITRTHAVLNTATTGAATNIAKPEGFIYSSEATAYPAKLTSVAQIQGKMIAVSGTDQAMSMYGIGDRFAYEAQKKTKEVVNDFELAFWWSLGSPPEGRDMDSSAAIPLRMTQGLMPWICTSGLERTSATPATSTDGNGNVFNPAGTLWAAAATTAYDAAGLALDRSMFKDDVMGPWWSLTGRTGGAVGFASPRVKNLFSDFALTANGAINDRTLSAAAKMVTDTVDYYETDYGVVSINMCRYLSESGQSTTLSNDNANVVAWNESLVFIHPEYFQIGVVRPVHFSPLGKAGDLDQGLVLGEQGLICRNPQAGTAVVNCIP